MYMLTEILYRALQNTSLIGFISAEFCFAYFNCFYPNILVVLERVLSHNVSHIHRFTIHCSHTLVYYIPEYIMKLDRSTLQ